MDKIIDIVAALQDEESAGRIRNYTARKAAARLLELEAENARLREALEIIAGKRLCLDGLMGNVDVARAALEGK